MNTKRRMLYITAFPPNTKSGGQKFSYNALKDLKKHYSIDLIYFDYPNHQYEEIEGVNVLRKEQPSLFSCALHPLFFPIFTKRFSYSLLHYIQSIAACYDVVFFDYLQVAFYSLFIVHRNKIIRCHDILGQKYGREKKWLVFWVKKCEKKILRSAKYIFTPSEKDSEIVKELYNLSSTYTNEYIEPYQLPNSLKIDDKFILFGLWSRYENLNGLIWFLDNVVKRIGNNIGKRIVVMGGGLSKENEIKYLKPYNIRYLGYVQDSYGEIAQCRAMIAPLLEGAGIKVKVLDSFNTGTPVIGTDIAFEGIRDLQGLSFRANTPDEFIQHINTLPQNAIDEKRHLQEIFFSYYNKRHLSEFLHGD